MMDLQLKIDRTKCLKCALCAKTCSTGALAFDKASGPYVTEGGEEKCMKCQQCFAVCPTGALSIFGLNPRDAAAPGHYPEPAQMESLMKNRRSCRAYKQENVAPEVIAELLNTLAYSPTGINRRALHFTLVDDIAVMEKLRLMSYEIIADKAEHNMLPESVARFAGMIPLVQQGKDPMFRTAPHCLFISTTPDAACADPDALIALTYFELLANTLGLGTTYWGLGYLLINVAAPELRKFLGITDDLQVRYAILFGKPAVNYKRAVIREPFALNVVR